MIQGSSAAMIKEALRDVRKYLIESGNYETNAYIILTVHDEINLEIRQGFEDKISKNIIRIMTESGRKYVKSFDIRVDVTSDVKWKK